MKKFIVGGAIFLTPFLAFAQTTFGTILGTIGGFINALIPILIAAGLAFFIYGVVRYVIAKDGDDKKKATGIIINGIIGLFVILSIWGLVGVIQSTFGIGTGATLNQAQMPGVCLPGEPGC